MLKSKVAHIDCDIVHVSVIAGENLSHEQLTEVSGNITESNWILIVELRIKQRPEHSVVLS